MSMSLVPDGANLGTWQWPLDNFGGQLLLLWLLCLHIIAQRRAIRRILAGA